MSQVKLAARFTKADQPLNGFTEAEFVAKTLREHGIDGYFVGRFTTRRITEELEDGVEVPTFAMVALEPLDGDDAAAAKALLGKSYEQRTGRRPDGAEQDPLFDVDLDDSGERKVPEKSGEEILAERAEAKAANGDGA